MEAAMKRALRILAWTAGIGVALYLLWPFLLLPIFMLAAK